MTFRKVFCFHLQINYAQLVHSIKLLPIPDIQKYIVALAMDSNEYVFT
jgi:hypothetical protein